MLFLIISVVFLATAYPAIFLVQFYSIQLSCGDSGIVVGVIYVSFGLDCITLIDKSNSFLFALH